jgi:serine protease Do
VEIGSGFLVDAQGYVVTSRHIVHAADRIRVALANGRNYEAVVTGMDAETDIALLHINTSDPLPFLSWGDSTSARVGDAILLIGSPFGLSGTVTRGIISARGTDSQREGLDGYFQIDAAMNQGNSGGPLIDAKGQVIGMNAAILSPTGGSVGIGFAVPSILVRPVVQSLRQSGRVDRVHLGVDVQPVTRAIADSQGRGEAAGALVTDVAPDGPSARAGIRRGDVILAVNGEPVLHIGDLSRLLLSPPRDRRMVVGLWRDGTVRTVSLAVETPEAHSSQQMPRLGAWPHEDTLGLVLAAMTEDLRKQFELPGRASGVLVIDVVPGSAAAFAGFKAGDIVQAVSALAVREPGDVAQQIWNVAQKGRRAALFLVIRDDSFRFSAVYIPEVLTRIR